MNSEDLRSLVTELLLLLNKTEESESGHLFHPNTIESCRAVDHARLCEIFEALEKDLL